MIVLILLTEQLLRNKLAIWELNSRPLCSSLWPWLSSLKLPVYVWKSIPRKLLIGMGIWSVETQWKLIVYTKCCCDSFNYSISHLSLNLFHRTHLIGTFNSDDISSRQYSVFLTGNIHTPLCLSNKESRWWLCDCIQECAYYKATYTCEQIPLRIGQAFGYLPGPCLRHVVLVHFNLFLWVDA